MDGANPIPRANAYQKSFTRDLGLSATLFVSFLKLTIPTPSLQHATAPSEFAPLVPTVPAFPDALSTHLGVGRSLMTLVVA